jgi:outer membrane protein assembly factor BamB
MLSSACQADDWPQWLGPKRDSVWRETGIVKSLPSSGLDVKWRAPVGYGYSGPAVAGGRVYLTDYQLEKGEIQNSPGRRVNLEGKERVLCLDAETGTVIWKHEYDCPYQVSYPAGPRATPTVADGMVYTLGCMGDLRCLDAEEGQLVWSKDLKAAYKAQTPQWGFSGHPLVDGDKLICLVGGENSVAVAFDRRTGKEIWRALSADEAGYCPPVIVEAGGTRQLIIWHAESINGLNPDTGEVYWNEPLKPSYAMSIATPRLSGSHLFVTGIGHKCVVLEMSASSPSVDVVWRGDPRSGIYCANSSPVIDNNVIYGVGHKGQLRGVDLKTGKRLWESLDATTSGRPANYATAFLVKHEDRYFLFNDQGELIVARLTTSGYDELGRAKVLEATNEGLGRDVVWTHPAFANRCLFARNDKELVCVSLAAQ